MHVNRRWQVFAVVVAILGGAVPVTAATHVVNQSGFTFDPQDVTIQFGDTVQWVHAVGSHTVTEGTGGGACAGCAFDSPLTAANPTYSVTFDAAFVAANGRPGNVYDYYCQPHFGLGMVGSVTVQTPIPTVSQWGLIIMGGLMIGAAVLILRRRMAPAQ